MNKFLLSLSRLLAPSEQLIRTSAKVNEVLHGIVGPCLSVIGSLGVIYIIILGVQYAKAESDDKRLECKKRMTNLAIGVAVLIVMLTLCFALNWAEVVPDLFGYLDEVKTPVQ